MAEEIEKFLMEKFSKGLLPGSSKVPLHSQFTKLKNLLERKMNSTLDSDEMRKLRDTLYDLNNVLTECRLLSSTRKVYTIDGQWYLKKTRTILIQKIKELQEPNDDAAVPFNHATSSHPNDVATLPVNAQYSRSSSRSVDTSKVHGLDDGLISVERMLFRREGEDRFKGIGIVGTTGIGKTTLAQLIFNKKEVKDYFLPRIWVCISKHPNDDEDPKVEIVKRMLICLGVEEEIIKSVNQNHKLNGLIYALQLQLKGKRYLIVLDDASASHTDTGAAGWYENLGCWLVKGEEWSNKLAYGLPKGNGGTVIVTSRDEELAEKMVGKENIYRVLPLSDPENWWSIFKDQLPEKVRQSNLKNLEAKFKLKCVGLPLAAKVMGQIKNEEVRIQDE